MMLPTGHAYVRSAGDGETGADSEGETGAAQIAFTRAHFSRPRNLAERKNESGKKEWRG